MDAHHRGGPGPKRVVGVRPRPPGFSVPVFGLFFRRRLGPRGRRRGLLDLPADLLTGTPTVLLRRDPVPLEILVGTRRDAVCPHQDAHSMPPSRFLTLAPLTNPPLRAPQLLRSPMPEPRS